MAMNLDHHQSKVPAKEAAAIYQRGLAAFETGRYPEAIDLLAIIAQQRSLPGTLAGFYLGQAHMRHGINELQAGRYEDAAEHLTAARRINPDSVDLWRFLTVSHVKRGRPDLAATELENARHRNTADEMIPIRLAHALARDGQLERAVETLEGAIGKQPARADLRLQLGLLQASADRFETAVEVLADAAGLAPQDVAIRQHLGLAYGALGMLTQAVEHLATAQKLRPDDSHIALLLTLAAKAAKDSSVGVEVQLVQATTAPVDQHAIMELGDIVTAEPDFVEAFLSLPESDVDAEVFGMLASILELALERHPDFADLYFHCSRVYARLGRTESAINQAHRAVEINPRYVQALIQLGRLYVQTDRRWQAIWRLQEAIAEGGDFPDVHCLLGEMYRRDGDTERACEQYRRALELNSSYAPARKALDAVLAA
jgi:tetratricopeptide (TPR) repeat protein